MSYLAWEIVCKTQGFSFINPISQRLQGVWHLPEICHIDCRWLNLFFQSEKVKQQGSVNTWSWHGSFPFFTWGVCFLLEEHAFALLFFEFPHQWATVPFEKTCGVWSWLNWQVSKLPWPSGRSWAKWLLRREAQLLRLPVWSQKSLRSLLAFPVWNSGGN